MSKEMKLADIPEEWRRYALQRCLHEMQPLKYEKPVAPSSLIDHAVMSVLFGRDMNDLSDVGPTSAQDSTQTTEVETIINEIKADLES